MASRPLPGTMTSHSDTRPVARPAPPIATGRVQPLPRRCLLTHAHSIRAPTPRPAATGTSRTSPRIVAVAGVSIVTWKAGWPPECSQETTVATQLTGTASSTPRRRMPGIMTISTA